MPSSRHYSGRPAEGTAMRLYLSGRLFPFRLRQADDSHQYAPQSGFRGRSQHFSPFKFKTLQSDHGAEFSKWFIKRIIERGMAHRHSRVRTPNDNAHLERFNRTLQEECLSRIPRSLRGWQKEIPEYLRYYNEERPHMGLQMKTPIDIIKTIPSY